MATKWLDRMLSSVADSGLPWVKLPSGSATPLQRAGDLARALIGERGEASGVALARALVTAYENLGEEERLAFRRLVATDFAPDRGRLATATAAYAEEPSPARMLDH